MNFYANFLYQRQLDCGAIERGSTYDCDNPLQGGTRPRLIVINKEDIASVTYGLNGVITAITLKSGKVAHAFEGFRNSVVPSLEKTTAPSGQALWKHISNFFVYENTQLWKNTLQKFANGKFVTIYQNAQQDSNAFEVQGLGNGLELQDGAVNNKNENGGAYNLILASGEQLEAKPPVTLDGGGGFAANLAIVDALLYLPSITNITDLAISTAGGDAETITGTNFFGGGSASDVQSVKWVNQSNQAETTQTSVTVTNNTTLSFSSVALAAGNYKLKVTTNRGIALSTAVVVVS